MRNMMAVLLVALLLPVTVANASTIEEILFGPHKFERDSQAVTKNFSISNVSHYSAYELRLINGAVNDKKSKVTSAKIYVNNQQIAGPNHFNKNTESLTFPLPLNLLAQNNTIKVEINGGPGTFMSINIVGMVDEEEESENIPPVARINAVPVGGFIPLQVLFDGLLSTDADGSIVSYQWNFGDGSPMAFGAMVNHIYLTAGFFNVTLTVTDNRGATHSASQQIQAIQPNAPPVARFVASQQSGEVPLAISFDASTSTDDQGIVSYQWNFGDGSAPQTGIQVSHTFSTVGNFTVVLTVADVQGLTNQAQLTIQVNPPANELPVANFTANVQSGIAPLMVLFDARSSMDPDGSITSYTWNFGDNTPITTGALKAHEFVNPGSYTVTLTVTDNSGGQSQRTRVITANPAPSVPDPATIAPALSETEPTSMADSIAFLYEGPNPTQIGVGENAIEKRRVAVLSGKVTDQNGQPIQGVEIKLLHDPQIGKTFTRQDGKFDLVANGGGQITVQYERQGYFPVQRQVQTAYLQFYSMPDIVLVRQDPNKTEIQMNSTDIQVAKGSVIQDSSGQRQAVVSIPSNTAAELIMPNGSRQSISQLTLRVTEYTVGENGPKAMPAPLPVRSAYTYAVEVSADEAIALGAEHIEFDKPVAFYVDNFLNFTVGGQVPVGVYDRKKDVWVPQPNGRVIRIQSEQNGRAVLVVNTSNQPATQSELNALNITDQELINLAQLYEPGNSLWRIQTNRFSTIDLNWPQKTEYDEDLALEEPTNPNDIPENCPTGECGSIIQVDTQSLGETIPIVGVKSNLNYTSLRQPGRKALTTLKIPIIPTELPFPIFNAELTINIAGNTFKKSYNSPRANLVETYTWDGQDGFSRKRSDAHFATVKLRYEFDSRYMEFLEEEEGMSFGLLPIGRSEASSPFSRQKAYLERTHHVAIGANTTIKEQGVAGWQFDHHHYYDPVLKKIYFGYGGERDGNALGRVITDVAGTGTPGYSGDGGPANQAQINFASGIGVSRSGNIYIADNGNNRIRKIDSSGNISTIAGTGEAGFSGDGGPATQARLMGPGSVVEAPNGDLYFEDFGNKRIRKIDKNGVITTIAGTGISTFNGDNIPAIQANLSSPRGVIYANDGAIYFGDADHNRVRRIGTDGIITTIAGNGQFGSNGDGGFATEAQLATPFLVGQSERGDLYIADSGNHKVRKVSISGIITTVAGIGIPAFAGDGQSTRNAILNRPQCVYPLANGGLYICDFNNRRLRYVGPDGIISTISGIGTAPYNGKDIMASRAALLSPFAITVDYLGNIFVADGGRIRKISKGFSGEVLDNYVIPSSDESEVYTFDQNGRHLVTRNARTGAIKWSFEYVNGQLSAFTDGDGNRTQVVRNSSGHPTQIISPYNQITNLSTHPDGYLASVTNPNNETYQMSYGEEGLLVAFQNPKGASSTFTYDNMGLLIKDQNVLNGFFEFAKTLFSNGDEIVTETAEGRTKSVRTVQSSSGLTVLKTDARGLVTTSTFPKDNEYQEVRPSQMTLQISEEVSPRFPGVGTYISRSAIKFNPTIATGNITTVAKSVSIPNPHDIFDYTETTTTTINGAVFTDVYNSASRTLTSTSPQNRVSSITVDPQERPVSIAVGNLEPVLLSYDERGRLSTTRHGLRTTMRTYNEQGYLSSQTDAIGRTTQFEYDNVGRVTKEILPDLREIRYSYDSNGNLESITPPEKPAHVFSYNLLDMVTEYLPPMLGGGPVNTQYQYNLDKDLTLITRPNGETASYIYDSAGRLSGIQTSVGNYSMTYDSVGRVAEIRSPRNSPFDFGATYSYAYQGSGDLPTLLTVNGATASGNRTFGFGYNSDFKVTSVVYDGQSQSPLTFAYSLDKLLIRAGLLNITYSDQTTLIAGTEIGNLSQAYSYNAYGEMLSDNVAMGAVNIYSMALTRDDLGRITTKSENANGVLSDNSYTYDLQGRLTSVSRNGELRTYTYDANGNRLSATIGGVTVNGVYDDQDRLITYGSNTYQYDANGDLVSKTTPAGTTTYRYDVFGNLRQYTLPNGQTFRYGYDARNRRISKFGTGTNFVSGYSYLNEYQILVSDDANGTTRYVYGTKLHVPEYMVRGGVNYKFITDQLGSVRMVVNVATGAVAQQMEYDEFGRVLVDTNPGFQPFGFAGGLYDAQTGLVQFGRRVYDPEIGRWLTKDPINFEGSDLNLYGYSYGDPVNFIDSNGMKPGDKFKTADEAARDALKYIRENLCKKVEHAGAVYRDADGNYIATDPVAGTADSSRVPMVENMEAMYHSHGEASPGAENFSGFDEFAADFAGRPSYLGTPSGAVKVYVPDGYTPPSRAKDMKKR